MKGYVPEVPEKVCCQSFADAFELETDNDSMGPLLAIVDLAGDGGQTVVIGANLPAVEFCPWCGEAV